MLPPATADLYRANQSRVAALTLALRSEWDLIGDDLDAGWRQRGPRIIALTSSAMVGAARDGAASVPAALAQTGHAGAPTASVDVEVFGTYANLAPYGDGSGAGVPLDQHLYGAVIRARSADSPSADARHMVGMRVLERLVHTQVVDAARSASSVAIAATPQVGYVRMVNPPCCQDCAVQAGKWFRYNQGFDRHPNCDCIHRPAHESESPAGYTRDIAPDDITNLTVGQRLALEDGADMSQVVNAYGRGWRKRMGDYTTEGTTRRGWHSYVQRELARQRGEILATTATQVGRRGYVRNYVVRRTGPRPTPDAIYRFARSREEAVRLLAANGYIVGTLSRVARLAS